MKLNRLAAGVVERSNTRNRNLELVLNQNIYGNQITLTQESRACQFSLYKRSVLYKTVQVLHLTPVQSQFLDSYSLEKGYRAYILSCSSFPPPRYLRRWQEKCCASSCFSGWISSVFLPARLPLKKTRGKARSHVVLSPKYKPKASRHQWRWMSKPVNSLEGCSIIAPAIYFKAKACEFPFIIS